MKTILIIDDDETVRTLLHEVLNNKRFKVIDSAENGITGFNKYKVLKPDIVLLDVMMPDGNGLDCLKNILDYDSSAKIIVISALVRDDLKELYKKIGALYFIEKPFKIQTMLNILENTG